ncbi:unnamed protein product [Porites lobata]|uniref:Uncharacterized protein n=1 Tax=Porites lobata TaxID=104759 RepID=A0ABN8Q235_9CNID|nr:unnamed protein product [Porites lobata]
MTLYFSFYLFPRQFGKVNSGFVIKTQWRKRSLAKQICLPLCDFSSFLKALAFATKLNQARKMLIDINQLCLVWDN